MRIILGIILGIVLTVGGVYIADTLRPAPAEGTELKAMVNWDVVGHNIQGLTERIQDGWNRLTGHKQG